MHFWLAKGIDGFRVDTVNKYSKHTSFPDAPIIDPTSYTQPAPQFWCNGPRIHEFIRELVEVMKEYKTFDGKELVTVGELSLTPEPEKVLEYVGAGRKELDMVFQFDITHLGQGTGSGFRDKYDFAEWKLPEMKRIVEKWQRFIEGTDGWTTVFNENHDNGRSVSRFASDAPEWREKSAKMLCLWLVAQTGTLFLYQGQEIGMLNAPRERGIEEYKDVESLNFWDEAVRLAEDGCDPTRRERIMHGLRLMARDHARLPFQWDASENAGFSSGKPWMRVHDLFKVINVEAQEKDAESVLEFYKRMLTLRKEHMDAFVYGAFELVEPENVSTFVFQKRFHDKMALVALNFTASSQPAPASADMKLLVSSYPKTDSDTVQPFEGRIYVNY
jgi:alpha-glucosidase